MHAEFINEIVLSPCQPAICFKLATISEFLYDSHSNIDQIDLAHRAIFTHIYICGLKSVQHVFIALQRSLAISLRIFESVPCRNVHVDMQITQLVTSHCVITF